jgi:hypothetical protein
MLEDEDEETVVVRTATPRIHHVTVTVKRDPTVELHCIKVILYSSDKIGSAIRLTVNANSYLCFLQLQLVASKLHVKTN